MRYRLSLSYRGTNYHGWQKQENSITVQQVLEEKFSTLLQSPIEITGCGRTDAGVHAQVYYAHFDYDKELPANWFHRINKMLPPDISIFECQPVPGDFHARFDAKNRTYEYYITERKDPFRIDLAWLVYNTSKWDWAAMNEMLQLLFEYKSFFPFCKSNSGLDHYACDITKVKWEYRDQYRVFHISANRFLRGMVRLIVGTNIYIGLGKISVQEVQQALERQERLTNASSAPAHGLFLTKVEY